MNTSLQGMPSGNTGVSSIPDSPFSGGGKGLVPSVVEGFDNATPSQQQELTRWLSANPESDYQRAALVLREIMKQIK